MTKTAKRTPNAQEATGEAQPAVQPQTRNGSAKYMTPALEKGLDIVEFLSEVGTPQSQAAIANALGRTVNEIFRMLATLEERRYIVRDVRSGEYTLSLRLFELAHSHSPIDQILAVSREPMRTFAADMLESCHLSILHQHDQVVLAHEESPRHITLNVKVGARLLAVRTTSGRLLLSVLPQDELNVFLADDQEFATFTAEERTNFFERLVLARRERRLVADSSNLRGVVDLSVLVGSARSGVFAALASAVPGPLQGAIDTQGILAALERRAAEITTKVGLLG